jgi:hypothetical protein
MLWIMDVNLNILNKINTKTEVKYKNVMIFFFRYEYKNYLNISKTCIIPTNYVNQENEISN